MEMAHVSEQRERHFVEEGDLVVMLREENKQLRELVIQLSKLVIRNAVDRK